MESCKRTLKKLSKIIYPKLHSIVDTLACRKTNYQIMSLAGMARIIYTPQIISSIAERDQFELSKDRQDHIRLKALDYGVYLNSNNCLMLSLFHHPNNVKKIIEVLDALIKF
jgi:glutamate-1-semialdehyde aminotransferase